MMKEKKEREDILGRRSREGGDGVVFKQVRRDLGLRVIKFCVGEAAWPGKKSKHLKMKALCFTSKSNIDWLRF